MNLKSLEGVVLELARALSPVGLEFFSGDAEATSTRKRDRTLVSAADRKVEETARAFLAKETPDFGFLGEETGRLARLGDLGKPLRSFDAAGVAFSEALRPHEHGLNAEVPSPLVLNEDTYWVIDPIDGTINFLARSPLWSTLVALVHKGEPVLGAVVLPSLGEIYIASRGNGARFGALSQPLASFQPCRVRQATSLAQAHISCSSPRTFTHRGVDGFFADLVTKSAELRTHSDAYGYTRVLSGGIDAMIDPIVAPYDVAAIQILFDETPGAHYTTLHGHTGPARHRMGTGVGACSEELGRDILSAYARWLSRQVAALPESFFISTKVFAETHRLAAERVPHSREEGPGSATAAWTLALEKAVAVFRVAHPAALVEDVSVLVSKETALSARVKNGALTTTPSHGTTLGVHVRAVVAGGCGLRTASLPFSDEVIEVDAAELLVAGALDDAWAQAQERGLAPHTEVLAWRDPVQGHFGEKPWDVTLDTKGFQEITDFLQRLVPNEAEEIQTVSSFVEVALEQRLQIFLDGAQQTFTRETFRSGASVVSRRGDEKRSVKMHLFENGLPPFAPFADCFAAELALVEKRARELLDAPMVPEDVEYGHLAVDADLLGLILHEAVGHAAEGDLVELGASGFGKPSADPGEARYVLQEGLEVAPAWIDITVDGTLDTCGILPVDCEGTVATRKAVVREGKLVDGLHTRQTARFAKRAPDGCARQESVFHPTLNRMTNIWVQARSARPLPLTQPGERLDRPAPESVQRVLEQDGYLTDDETVLYLSGWKGGTASCSNLEFRADVAFIHELRRGKPPRLLREANFTGIATDCFLSAVAAYGPVLCHTVGMCGKDAQGVPTSDGGPAILVLAKTPRVTVIGSGDSSE